VNTIVVPGFCWSGSAADYTENNLATIT